MVMASQKKKTDRLQREKQLEALETEGEACLNILINNVDQKHQNGGIFDDVAHHKRTQVCMQAMTEEELEDG